jgi:phosphoglucosamine mutase
MDVFQFGPLPTPAVAMLTRSLRADLGVMISASHNQYHDNGIKLFGPDGQKLSDEREREIEALMENGLEDGLAEPAKIGRARRIEDAQARYIEFVKRTFPKHLRLEGLRIVVDCAHGAAYHVAPDVFHELGAEVFAVAASPNGFNINDGVGAVHADRLADLVRKHGAHLGIALDGDGDRVVLADDEGRVYNGDQLLYVIVRDRMSHSKVQGAVGTQMTNFALERRFAQLGVAFERAQVGDRYVLERLEKNGWLFGGEGSGHLLCLDKHTTGDGIISALQVLAAVRRADRTLAQLTEQLSLMPQHLVNVQIEAGFDWASHEALKRELSAVQRELDGSGRVLIRPSGTEPVLRVMVEAEDLGAACRYAERLAASVR